MNILGFNISRSETTTTKDPGTIKLSRAERDRRVIRVTEWSNERSRKDIQSWRTALMTAENIIMPRRWDLIKLYDELELDSHMIMLRNRYRRHLTGRPFVLRKLSDGKPDPEATKLLQKRWFYDLLMYKSDSKFFGNSVAQIKDIVDGEIASVELVKRKFIVPELGGYIQQQGSADVIPYRTDPELMKWIFEADNGNFGYFNPAAPYILFKKNALVAWSEFCEIFGLPIRYVETDNTTKGDIDRLRKALVNMGKSAYGIFHTGESLKFEETKRTDAYKVFDMLREACNMELSKMILGETMTSDVGSTGGNRALGEVHQNTSDETAEENRMDATIWVNQVVLPVLNIHGYKLEGYEFAYPPKAKFLDSEWKVLEGLLKEFDIEPQYFIDKYNVPITGKKETKNPVADNDKLIAAIEQATNGDYAQLVRMHQGIEKLYGHICEDTNK